MFFFQNLLLHSGSLFPSAVIIFNFNPSSHILFLGVTSVLGFSTYSSDQNTEIKKACNSFLCDAHFLMALKAEVTLQQCSELLPQEIYRVRDILRNKERNHVDFKLNRSIYDDFTNMGEYKRNFRVNLLLQRNEARYKMTGDYWDSLEEIKAGVFYSQNRFGIGYEVDENADWRDKKGVKEWGKVDREHKISLVTKIGKPSEGWTLKTYAKFYEDLTGKIKQSSDERARKSSLDGLGIEIGKEMGYYQWSVAFEKEYVLSARDYEWRAALQFTLLTFPSNPIFGIGANTDVNKKIKPETYMFDGLKVEDIID